jgi:hypothetical protein
MNREEKGRKDRPESYPKPTEADQQLKNQDEYSTMQPNSLSENPDISGVSTGQSGGQQQPSTENKSIEGS